MFKTIDFVEALRLRLGTSDAPASYYRVAKRLEIGQNSVTNYTKGRSTFDENVAIRAARLLDLPPAFVVACVNCERSRADESRCLWLDVEEKYAPPALRDFLSHFNPQEAARALNQCILC